MKKGKLLKTCSIILASFLIVSAVTTDVSYVAKAEEAQTDSSADFDLPVIEEFKCTPSNENLTSNDSLNIEIRAYDAISGIKDIKLSVGFVVEKDQHWLPINVSFKNNEIVYDKEKKAYVVNIPLKCVYTECTVIVQRLEITDNNGNKLSCGSLENGKTEDVLVKSNPNNLEHEYKYTYNVKPDLADSGITISNLHPSENVEAQSDGSYKVTGDTVTFEFEASDNSKKEDYLFLNYKVDSSLHGTSLPYISTGKNRLVINIKEIGDSLKNNHEIKFSDFALRTSDGTYKKINVADGMKTAFTLNYTREQQNHESEKVETSIEFFKDGQPLKNMDKVVKGDKISCKVTFNKEITFSTNNIHPFQLYLYPGCESIDRDNNYVKLKLDENNKKLASAEIDTANLYPTAWAAAYIMADPDYNFILKNHPEFILTTENGSTNISNSKASIWILGEYGMTPIEGQLLYGSRIEESAKTYIDKFENNCEFKPTSWGVYSDENGGYKKVSSLSDFRIPVYFSGTYKVLPEFDSNVRYCPEYVVKDDGTVYAKGYKYRKFEDGITDEQIAELLTKELKKNSNICDSFDKIEASGVDNYYSDNPVAVKLGIKYSYYNVTFNMIDPIAESYVKETKKFKSDEIREGIISYLKNKTGVGNGFAYWSEERTAKKDDVSLEQYYGDLFKQYMANANSYSFTLYAKYAGKKTYRPFNPISQEYFWLLADESASEEEVFKLAQEKVGKLEIKGAKNPRIEFESRKQAGDVICTYLSSNVVADNAVIQYGVRKPNTKEYTVWYEGANDGDCIKLPSSYGEHTNITWNEYYEDDKRHTIKDNKITIGSGKNYRVYGEDSTESDEPEDKPSTEQPTDKPQQKPTETPEEKPVDKPSTEKPSEPTVVLPEDSKLESEPVISGAEGNNVTVENKLVIGTNNTVKDENGVTKLDKNTADAVANQITKTLLETEKAKAEGKHVEKTVVKVELADATTVPKEILEAAKGSDVDVVLEMSGGYSWTINGNDIKASNLKEINLEVKQYVDVVPSGLIKELAGDKPTRQLSLTHNGDFGFKATLNFNMGSEYAGQYGNLYYYDSEGKLKFQNAGKIGEDGTCGVVFSHASDYVVVVGEDMTPSTAKAPVTGDNANLTIYFVLLFVGIVLFSSIAFVWFRKKSRA